MDVWDAMCRTIMSAGHRRGAMMATLRCDHPDIEAFIEAKREPGRLRMFNLSVLVTDAFMTAVQGGRALGADLRRHDLSRCCRARELWDKIMRATYAYAEPGVIFIDRINRRNNLHYCETISATNPCVTGRYLGADREGPRQVARAGRAAFDRARRWQAPIASGAAGLLRDRRKAGAAACARAKAMRLRLTADHPVRGVTASHALVASRRNGRRPARCEPGDRDPAERPSRRRATGRAPHARHEGYLLGLLVGDGTLKADKAVLSVWPAARRGQWRARRVPASQAMMAAALGRGAQHCPIARISPAGSRSPGAANTAWRSAPCASWPISSAWRPATRRSLRRWSVHPSAFYRGFLRGLFDCDGSVQGTQAKGVSVRLAQSDLPRLEAVQRMLLRLGIASTIYRDRRPAGRASCRTATAA